MVYFATDYLKSREGPDDWVCVEDFAGRDRMTGMRVDFTAHWSPSRKLVAFGNTWDGVPDMPSEKLPSPESVQKWATEHPNWFERHFNACVRREEEYVRRSRESEEFYKRHGSGRAVVVYRNPDGVEVEIEGSVGVRGPVRVMRDVRSNLKAKYGTECPIVSLKVYRRVPRRGEHAEK